MPRYPSEHDIRRVYQQTLDDFYGVISRRCDGDRALTEDVVQETWLRAVHAWRRDGMPERPMAWLTTVGSRLLSNHFRRRGGESLDLATAVPAIDEAICDERSQRRSLVERALDRLPTVQMRLLEAFHFERRPVSDIATSLGLTERAVEGRLRRARINLKRQIEADPSTEDDQP
jgi:RNA polymerase sigma-70 factor, ECF subfamily